MTMKHLIVANWKCNPSGAKDALDIFRKTEEGIKGIENVETVICAPSIFISVVTPEKSSVKTGGQDCHFEEKGAFTGETSPAMLRDAGCDYVIIGHSERRKYQGETDETVNKKIRASLKFGLKPILCIDNPDQIRKGTEGLSKEDFGRLAVAFEPIWAIGTGKACGIPEAKEMNTIIRGIVGEDAPVLYGGSVNSQNARGYIEEAGFNGLLVGGASLKPDEFLEIIRGVDSAM